MLTDGLHYGQSPQAKSHSHTATDIGLRPIAMIGVVYCIQLDSQPDCSPSLLKLINVRTTRGVMSCAVSPSTLKIPPDQKPDVESFKAHTILACCLPVLRLQRVSKPARRSEPLRIGP